MSKPRFTTQQMAAAGIIAAIYAALTLLCVTGGTSTQIHPQGDGLKW